MLPGKQSTPAGRLQAGPDEQPEIFDEALLGATIW
jgi:hypothetical protein